MKSFFKLIVVLLMLAAVFGTGYFMGSFRLGKLDRMLAAAKSEMTTKVSGLENEVHSLRFRMQLTTARDRLIAAENNIKERNFGMAEKELESAQEELRTAAKMASKETGEMLIGLEGPINGVIAIVHRSDSRAKVKLNEVKTQLDRLIEKS
jgi:outer membrane murein-binding lipoprotein Lpp